jgi:hypothetical protein
MLQLAWRPVLLAHRRQILSIPHVRTLHALLSLLLLSFWVEVIGDRLQLCLTKSKSRVKNPSFHSGAQALHVKVREELQGAALPLPRTR